MSTYDRKEQMKELHKSRKLNTQKKVDEAIRRLIKFQKPINFNSVAKEGGITKATLYNNEDIKSRIESLRKQQSKVASPLEVKHEMDEKNKDAVIASLKRKIKKLEEENSSLKEQVKINYVEFYKEF